MKTTFFFFFLLSMMSSTSSEHHLLDMTMLSKLSLFRTELIIFLPILNPWTGSSFGIWVSTPLYSVLHCDSGSLRVTLIGSSSSTNPWTTVDSDSSLSPVSLPLLGFSSLAAVLTHASIICAYVPFIICLFPKSQSHPLSSYHPPWCQTGLSSMQMTSHHSYFQSLRGSSMPVRLTVQIPLQSKQGPLGCDLHLFSQFSFCFSCPHMLTEPSMWFGLPVPESTCQYMPLGLAVAIPSAWNNTLPPRHLQGDLPFNVIIGLN